MDLWVVAAAAGAGYVAKNLQNLSLDNKKENSGEPLKYSIKVQTESRNFLQQIRDKTCPLRRLARKTAQGDIFLEVESHPDASYLEFDGINNKNLEAGLASTRGEALEAIGVPGLPWDYHSKESLEFGDGKSRAFRRANKAKIDRSKRRRVHSVKPLNCAGSCCDARLLGDNTTMEESMGSILLSIPTLITCGNRIISRPSSKEEVWKENDVSSDKLLRFESDEDSKMKPRTSPSQGPDEGMLFFIIGMTIGILCTITTSKNEVDNLSRQLQQTQNLVEDLHEELDMREMLKVEELRNEDFHVHIQGKSKTPPSVQEPIASPSDVKVKTVAKYDSANENNENMENAEMLMGRIEAELEAELEMLEQNMKVSSIERVFDVVELDPDFEPIVVQGGFDSTMVSRIHDETSESTDTTPHVSQSVNFMVSPWELSFRLHELIQSRLEARIKELETALAHSRNRDIFFCDEVEETSSTSQSPPTCASPHDKIGNRLSTENSHSSFLDEYGISSFEGLDSGNNPSVGRKMIDGPILDAENRYVSNHTVVVQEDRPVQTSSSFMSNEDYRSEDDDDDESEMLLIRQIIERRKSGSFVLNLS